MLNTWKLAKSSQSSAHLFLRNLFLRNLSSFIPRRAVLYVPADDPRKIAKIPGLDVDCPVLECEDGVSLNRKDAARQGVLDTLTNSSWVKERKLQQKDVATRINSVTSGLAEEDFRVILSGPILPTTVFIPKTDSTDEIEWISEKIQKYLPSKKPSEDVLRLIIYVESAKSLLFSKNILEKALQLADKRNLFQIDGVVFGSDDYCADIGATRSNQATEVFFARQYLIAVVKSFQRQLQAIDLVHINYKDLEDLRRQAEEGARFGFTGKQIIHPNQTEIVQSAFSSSEEKVKWATELISAFEKHQSDGKGAFTFGNSMIDRPLLLQAQNIVQLQKIFKRK